MKMAYREKRKENTSAATSKKISQLSSSHFSLRKLQRIILSGGWRMLAGAAAGTSDSAEKLKRKPHAG
jgi:hypothetical protein